MTRVPDPTPGKVLEQIRKAALPEAGAFPFRPKLAQNRRGDPIIEKAEVDAGPKSGKRGWVDAEGRIWVKDRAHADVADHWDVQFDGGREYLRVDPDGNLLP